jgi:hypothetical protein
MNLTHEDSEFCNAGGLAKILFIAVSEIASMPDIINGWISEINVLPGGVIYAFDIVQDSAKFSEKKIGPNFYEYQVELLISKNRLAIRNNLEKIDKREFIALAQDNNGYTRVIGSLDNACRFSDEAESGSNFADLNNYKVSIVWKSRTRAAYFPISEPTDEGTSVPIIPISRDLALDDLIDVTISTPENNQVLAYNSAIGQWENKTIYNDYVTVGTGADYATITLAKNAFKNRLKLISHITDTFTLIDFTIIDCNGYNITGNITNTFNTQRLEKLSIVGNFVNNADDCVFSDIRCGNITNTNGAICNVFDNIQYTGTATDSDATTRKWDVYKK